MSFIDFTKIRHTHGWAGLIVETVCLGWVWFLGIWTLCCHQVVLRQAAFESLWPLLPIAIILAIAGFAITVSEGCTYPDHHPEESLSLSPAGIALPLAVAVILVILYGITNNFMLFWSSTTVALALAYWQLMRQGAPSIKLYLPASGSWQALLGLGIIAIIATAVIHRTHGDDAFYLNLIVAALDHPDQPLMLHDRMHGLPNLPLLLPVYRIHSLELLAAAVTQITGISHLWVRNFWQPLAIAPLVIFASALFFRVFVPRHWLTLTSINTILLVVLTTAAGLGNFSFGRLQQGKPIFVAILVPLIIVYTLRYLTAPTIERWLILIVANIAAVGASSTALYAAPLTVCLTACGYWYPTREATTRSALAMTTGFYPLGLALMFMLQVKESSPNMTNLEFEAIANNDFVLQLHHGAGGYFFWVAVLSSWAVFQDSSRRRFFLGIILAFMLGFMNPYLQEFWAVNLTGVPTFARLWWVIPRHLLLTLILSFPLLYYPFVRYEKQVKLLGCGLAATGLIILSGSLSPNLHSPQIDFNRIQYRFPPQPKLPNERLDLIRRIQAKIPAGSYILVPAAPVGKEVAGDELARWMIVDRQPLYPIVVTESYLQVTNFFSEPEAQRRRWLSQYISGTYRTPNGPELLEQSVAELSIKGVIVPLSNPWEPEIDKILSALGFRMTVIDDYALWIL